MNQRVTKVTNGIQITVHVDYMDAYSRPDQSNYLFSYFITIQNNSDYTVQLHRRHWKIVDSNGMHREVDGEGVVGQQPVLNPGEIYRYESACNLTTDMGKMWGTYLFERKIDGQLFNVNIPEFEMVVPFKLN